MVKSKTKTIVILCLIIAAACSVIYYFDELGIRNIPIEKLKAKVIVYWSAVNRSLSFV